MDGKYTMFFTVNLSFENPVALHQLAHGIMVLRDPKMADTLYTFRVFESQIALFGDKRMG